MKYVRLGKSTLDVSEIGIGSQNWGEQTTERESHAQLDWALERGINFVDTAEMYPAPARPKTQGDTERIIGAWLSQHRHRRGELVIASKIAGSGQGDWLRDGDMRVSKKTIPRAIDESLGRLGTEYLDLYQIHWPERYVPNFGEWQFDPAKDREAVPILEQIEAMAAAIKAGKIRAYGLSNESCFGLCEFIRVARENNLPEPVSIQNVYNLVSRIYDGELAEAGYRLNVPLLAYGVLGKGLLSGKFRNGQRPPETRMVKFPRPGERYLRPKVMRAADAYAGIADRHGISMTGLALAFVRSRFFAASTLIGATSIAQLDEHAAYFDYRLSPEALAEIDAVHAECPSPAAQ